MIARRKISALSLAALLPMAVLAQQAGGADNLLAARELAEKGLMVDTHIDVPYRLEESWADVTQQTQGGDFDYWRAREGGLDVAFMSIYTPASREREGGSFELANRMIERVEALAGRMPQRIAVVRTADQAVQAKARGQMAFAMGMENGSPLEGKLENVAFFRERGISYIALAHAESNHLADSSYDENRSWNGLSPFGRTVIAEMNRLGIMVDVTHLSDDAFWQALEISQTPVIASHSSARHFTPGWERNMSDEMIKAMAAAGGVIMINFGSSFVKQEARLWYEEMDVARSSYLKANGYEEHGSEADAFQLRYRVDHPFPYASLADVVAHFRHVIDLVGVEHVGFGSDFDGVGDSLPHGMKDVSDYPGLIAELLRMGLSSGEVEAIMGGNLLRVWSAADRFAERAAQPAG
jgi:membrane dipeptidase